MISYHSYLAYPENNKRHKNFSQMNLGIGSTMPYAVTAEKCMAVQAVGLPELTSQRYHEIFGKWKVWMGLSVRLLKNFSVFRLITNYKKQEIKKPPIKKYRISGIKKRNKEEELWEKVSISPLS